MQREPVTQTRDTEHTRNTTGTAAGSQQTKDTREVTERYGALRERLERRGLEFERMDAWQRIEEHVETHRYMLDLRTGTGVAWADAEISWERTVLNPLVEALERQQACAAFPNRAKGDLYIEVSDHWYYLKQQEPEASPDEAVVSFTRSFGTRVARWISRNLYSRLMDSLRRGWERGMRIDARVRKAQEAVASESLYY